MGGDLQFRGPLTRAELRGSGAGGPHRGEAPPNLPWAVYLACAAGDTIDVATYVALHTEVDLDGLFDIIELRGVHNSWRRAAYLNATENKV